MIDFYYYILSKCSPKYFFHCISLTMNEKTDMIVPLPTKITDPIENECMIDLETMGVTAKK